MSSNLIAGSIEIAAQTLVCGFKLQRAELSERTTDRKSVSDEEQRQR